MANIVEDTPAAYPTGIYQIEDGDPATGGASGIAVLPHKQQANRTKYLKEHVDTLETTVAELGHLGPELPIMALDYPTIFTSDNKLAVTGSAGTNGGTISSPATHIALAKEIQSGQTGRLGWWTLPALTSPALSINTTYYLRCNITAGVIDLYLAFGADTDVIPGSLRSTGGAASSGFDTTRIDMLLAKIVTGGAGTVPTVTPLVNAARLEKNGAAIETFTRTSAANRLIVFQQSAKTLNWARIPVQKAFSMMSQLPNGGSIEQLFMMESGTYTDGTGGLAGVVDRYQFRPVGYATLTQASTSFTVATHLRWSLGA